MYARVEITGLRIPNAMLVPERALQQLIGETLVLVAQPDDLVIVEGLTNLRDGMPLDVISTLNAARISEVDKLWLSFLFTGRFSQL